MLRRKPHPAWLAVLVVPLLLVADATGPDPRQPTAPPPADRAPLSATVAAEGQPAERAGRRPARLRIPAIGVDTAIEGLRLDRRGELTPPRDYARAGWFTAGPAPGEPGPAVLAGHVDSKSGPAVFYRLHELNPGDRLLVTRADGGTARFRVTAARRYPKRRFPTDQVYGPTPDVALRLVTCAGWFDRKRRSYRDNIVVYAVRADLWAGR